MNFGYMACKPAIRMIVEAIPSRPKRRERNLMDFEPVKNPIKNVVTANR